MGKIIYPATEAANVRKCANCGVNLAVESMGVTISRGVIMDEKGNMFCSWWCKGEYKREMDL